MAATNSSMRDSWVRPTIPCECLCGLEVPMWTSNKPNSRGRRFIACPFLKVREQFCGFFQWYDQEFCDRAKVVIRDMAARVEDGRLRKALVEAKVAELEAVKISKDLEIAALRAELTKSKKTTSVVTLIVVILVGLVAVFV